MVKYINVLKILLIFFALIFSFNYIFLDLAASKQENDSAIFFNEDMRHFPSIDDNFDDDQVIVTLKAGYFSPNKKIDKENLFETSDLFEVIEDLTYITDSSLIDDENKFFKIIRCTLKNKSVKLVECKQIVICKMKLTIFKSIFI